MVSNAVAALVARALRIAAVVACAIAVLAWPVLLFARTISGDLPSDSTGSSQSPPVNSSLTGLFIFMVALAVAAAFAAAAAVLSTSRPIGAARIIGAVIAAAISGALAYVAAWMLGLGVVVHIVQAVLWLF